MFSRSGFAQRARDLERARSTSRAPGRHELVAAARPAAERARSRARAPELVRGARLASSEVEVDVDFEAPFDPALAPRASPLIRAALCSSSGRPSGRASPLRVVVALSDTVPVLARPSCSSLTARGALASVKPYLCSSLGLSGAARV